MRLHSVFAKTVYDRRHGLLWWSLGIGLLTVAVLSVWPSVRDEYQTLVKNYPEALLAFFGIDKGGVGSAAGYLQAELFGFMLPLMLIAYMIAGGSAATAGEREAGTLELLLAQPVSRTRVLVQKYAGAVRVARGHHHGVRRRAHRREHACSISTSRCRVSRPQRSRRTSWRCSSARSRCSRAVLPVTGRWRRASRPAPPSPRIC